MTLFGGTTIVFRGGHRGSDVCRVGHVCRIGYVFCWFIPCLLRSNVGGVGLLWRFSTLMFVHIAHEFVCCIEVQAAKIKMFMCHTHTHRMAHWINYVDGTFDFAVWRTGIITCMFQHVGLQASFFLPRCWGTQGVTILSLHFGCWCFSKYPPETMGY